MQNEEGRRPLKVRTSRTAGKIAKWLSQKDIKPNTISIFSIIFSVLSAICLVLMPYQAGLGKWLLPLLAALFIQMRLLCNLFDGMVAVEGKKGTASGELYNDIPDRISDPIILIAAGYAVISPDISVVLGWCAGLFAMMTAYVRTLATSIGAPTNFQGPMAKQHRMALMTVACLLSALEPYFWTQGYIMLATILVIIVGSVLTVYNRVRAAYLYLEQHGDA